MNQGLRRGVRTVSWTRVLPPRARQGPIHRGWQARGIQIRAAASEQPATVNGDNISITSTPNSAESRGMPFYCEHVVVAAVAVAVDLLRGEGLC